jgi:hypothetical protein
MKKEIIYSSGEKFLADPRENRYGIDALPQDLYENSPSVVKPTNLAEG